MTLQRRSQYNRQVGAGCRVADALFQADEIELYEAATTPRTSQRQSAVNKILFNRSIITAEAMSQFRCKNKTKTTTAALTFHIRTHPCNEDYQCEAIRSNCFNCMIERSVFDRK
jgi:hypothetical protein